LDFITIEKRSDSLKITKPFGFFLPEDEMRSIMGRAIPPEWTVNLLSHGKEPWRFKDLEDQLERIQTSPMMEKEKIVIGIITILIAGAVVLATAILIAEDAEDVEDVEDAAVIAVIAVGEETIGTIYKMSNVSIVARKATIPLTVPCRERITMKIQTWFPRRISKTCFNPQ
jgi:hypothetical protein